MFTMTPPELLRAMFQAAVDAAAPSLCVPPHLPKRPKGRTIVIGAGKASGAMAKAVEDHWDGPLEGLVVTRYGHKLPTERIEVVEARHPVPDAAGREAAARVLELVQGLTPDDLVMADGSSDNKRDLTVRLAKGCYEFTKAQKELLATANLLNSLESIAGMLPI